MRKLAIVGLVALLGFAGTAPAHAQSNANQTDNTPSVSNSNSTGDEQNPHVKIMWGRLLDNPPPKAEHKEKDASPNNPIPLVEAVPEYTTTPPMSRRRGDFTFQLQLPYFSFYEWVPPIGNQPIPYGLHYW